MIYAVRATAGQEKVAAEILFRDAQSKLADIQKEGGDVYSVLYTTGLKGYMLVEADSPGTVEDLARDVPKTRGLLLKEKGRLESAGGISIEELEETEILELFSLSVEPHYLFIAQLLDKVLPAARLVVDTPFEGAVEAGAGKLAAFIPVVAVFGQ